MIDEKELRECVEYIKKTGNWSPACHKNLLALAEAYQKVGEGLPRDLQGSHYVDYDGSWKQGYNEALQDSRLAYTKKLMSGDDYKDKYFALIMAVGNKYADETRHETALRYIINAETGTTDTSSQCDLTNHSEEVKDVQ